VVGCAVYANSAALIGAPDVELLTLTEMAGEWPMRWTCRSLLTATMVMESAGKVKDGKRLGADEVVISKKPEEMAAHANSFDFMRDTVAGPHEISRYLDLLKRDGT
jgi:hypothetical protein